MIKFATIKDPHLRFGFNKPIGRTENFFEEVNKKFDFIIDVCREEGIRYLLVPGDIFDIKAPHKYSIYQITESIKFFEKFKKAGIEWLTIAGNHDLPFSSISKKDQSIYRLMTKYGLIRDVGENPIDVDGTYITGVDYVYPEKSIFEKLDQLHQNLDPNKVNIVMLHQHFIPDNSAPIRFAEFFKYQDLYKYDKINVFVMGHLHKGFDIKSRGHMTFINQWSFVRLTREYYTVEDDHIPTVTIHDGKKFRVLKTPYKKYKEAFIEKEVEYKNQFDKSLEEFINEMKQYKGRSDKEITPPEDIKSMVEYYLQRTSDKQKRGGKDDD